MDECQKLFMMLRTWQFSETFKCKSSEQIQPPFLQVIKGFKSTKYETSHKQVNTPIFTSFPGLQKLEIRNFPRVYNNSYYFSIPATTFFYFCGSNFYFRIKKIPLSC